jgi:hypothetical protein
MTAYAECFSSGNTHESLADRWSTELAQKSLSPLNAPDFAAVLDQPLSQGTTSVVPKRPKSDPGF